MTVIAIRTNALSKSFGDQLAVNALNLEVPTGSVYGFLGPNGAGKTTTIRLLLGLSRPTSGEAFLFDRRVGSRGGPSKRIGAMVEQPAFYDYLSGADNLRVFAATVGFDLNRRDAGKLLERIGLGAAASRRAGGYSLGMRQLLAIGIALLGDPQLLFLDEPTNGLDPEGARQIRTLLSSLRAEGKTIFLSTHLLLEMDSVCTHVGVIQGGNLLYSGETAMLVGDDCLRLRVDSVEKALALLPAAKGSVPGWLEIAAAPAGAPAIVKVLVEGGVGVFEVSPQSRSLEQFYFDTLAQQRGTGSAARAG